MRLSAVVLASLLCVAPVASAQDWIDYVSKEDRFSCNFPGEPTVTQTTIKSQFGADLPARIYSASQGQSKYSMTVIDYAPVEQILTEKSKSCPAGSETCRGGGTSTGLGYWRADKAGAMVYWTWQLMKRPGAEVTEFGWTNMNLVEGHLLQITNKDKSRTFASIFMHEDKLYIAEGTVPAGYPEPGLFQQSVGWIDAEGKNIRYQTFYHNGFPMPARGR